MTDRWTEKILSEARASLEPTPSDRDRMNRRIMGAIGAGAVVTAAGASTAGTAKGLIAALGLPAGATSIVKLTAGGLLLGGVIAMGVVGIVALHSDAPRQHVQSADEVAPPENSATPPVTEKTAVNPSMDAPAEIEAAATQAVPVDGAVPPGDEPSTWKIPPVKGGAKKPAAPQRNVSSANDDALLQEIALIKAASRAIHNGQYDNAEQLLQEYQNRFPEGIMRQERDGLHISALCGAGKIPLARRADREFRTRYHKPPLMFQVDGNCTAEGAASQSEK